MVKMEFKTPGIPILNLGVFLIITIKWIEQLTYLDLLQILVYAREPTVVKRQFRSLGGHDNDYLEFERNNFVWRKKAAQSKNCILIKFLTNLLRNRNVTLFRNEKGLLYPENSTSNCMN